MKTLIALLLLVGVANAQSLTVTNQKSIEVATKNSFTFNAVGKTANVRDYVAIYVAGSITYFDWFYVATGTKTRAAKGSTTGIVKFPNLKPGTAYEAKLYALTDAGAVSLQQTVAFVSELVGVEFAGFDMAVTRKLNNDTDQISISLDEKKGTLIVPKDTAVIVDGVKR